MYWSLQETTVLIASNSIKTPVLGECFKTGTSYGYRWNDGEKTSSTPMGSYLVQKTLREKQLLHWIPLRKKRAYNLKYC